MTSSRRQARERALELLYEAESKRVPPADLIAALPLAPDKFAADLVTGVADHQVAIDAIVGRFSRGWKMERMPMIDRLLLRMGTFELTERPDIPAAVAISEAVELAKRYSTDDSGRFVNGVLAAIADEVRAAT